MTYTIPAAQAIGGAPLTIVNLVALMAGNHPPANVTFANLGNPTNTTSLGPRQGAAIAAGPAPAVTRSVGLITCASVCYVDTATNIGYVYHANAGYVGQLGFQAAMTAIGAAAPYNTVYIAYAHPGPTDAGYQQTIADFVTWGVPTHQIVEITDLFIGQFGMNNLLQIGY